MSFVYSTADTLGEIPSHSLYTCQSAGVKLKTFVPYLLCTLFCECLIKKAYPPWSPVTRTAVDALNEKTAIITCQPSLQAMGELSIRLARSPCSSCSTMNEPLQLGSSNVLYLQFMSL